MRIGLLSSPPYSALERFCREVKRISEEGEESGEGGGQEEPERAAHDRFMIVLKDPAIVTYFEGGVILTTHVLMPNDK